MTKKKIDPIEYRLRFIADEWLSKNFSGKIDEVSCHYKRVALVRYEDSRNEVEVLIYQGKIERVICELLIKNKCQHEKNKNKPCYILKQL